MVSPNVRQSEEIVRFLHKSRCDDDEMAYRIVSDYHTDIKIGFSRTRVGLVDFVGIAVQYKVS